MSFWLKVSITQLMAYQPNLAFSFFTVSPSTYLIWLILQRLLLILFAAIIVTIPAIFPIKSRTTSKSEQVFPAQMLDVFHQDMHMQNKWEMSIPLFQIYLFRYSMIENRDSPINPKRNTWASFLSASFLCHISHEGVFKSGATFSAFTARKKNHYLHLKPLPSVPRRYIQLP